VRDGQVRDCHGDLRLQHIYAFDEPGTETHPLEIIDCIEFNERFRSGDVAAEVAFVTMELDAAGRSDLARAFVDAYVEKTRDTGLRELLPFYMAYRARVRGKVLSFELDEPEVAEAEREVARRQAEILFQLAATYASGPTGPALLLVGGLMGAGKSTLALALQRVLGWALFSSDWTRKRLVDDHVTDTRSADFGAGIYSEEWSNRTYDTLTDTAFSRLSEGHSVILDATWSSRTRRQRAAQMAGVSGASVIFLECLCPREVALERLARRWQAKRRGALAPDAPSAASDGRPGLYDAQATSWQPYDPAAEPSMRYVVLDATQPVAALVERALEALEAPRQACWLVL
jgi:predicted kinase